MAGTDMDTIRMHWQNEKQGYKAISLLEELGKSGGVTRKEKEHVSPDAIYRKIITYSLNDKHIYLMASPRFRKMPSVAVSFHASKFRNSSELFDWLAQLFAGEIDFLFEAVISRIDLCIDLSLSFDTVFKSVTKKRSRTVLLYTSSSGKTIYFGSPPTQTVIYEKNVEFEDIDWWADDKRPQIKNNKIKGLRLESRYFGNKCPIRSLSEIHKLNTIHPFSNLEAKKFDLAVIANVNPRAKRRIESFLYRTQLYGFDVTRKEENRSSKRHFANSIGRYLVPMNLDFKCAWQNHCDRYFNHKK